MDAHHHFHPMNIDGLVGLAGQAGQAGLQISISSEVELFNKAQHKDSLQQRRGELKRSRVFWGVCGDCLCGESNICRFK